MKEIKIIHISKKTLYISLMIAFAACVILVTINVYWFYRSVPPFFDSQNGIIVIDPGHGGIDGGANKDGLLEKDVNLDISKKLKSYLEIKGYKIIMTRDEDVSLDSLCKSGGSRHQKDLNARVNIINNCNAQLFLSVHVNCNLKNPKTEGSIVFYSDKYLENKTLAYSIQRALNGIIFNGRSRDIHDPQKANFFILSHSNIPGVIIETSFISNMEERQLLTKDEFRDELAKGICTGVEKYLSKSSKFFVTGR